MIHSSENRVSGFPRVLFSLNLPSLEFLPLQLEVISFNALISSCEKGQQWQLALSLLGRMQQDPWETVRKLASSEWLK